MIGEDNDTIGPYVLIIDEINRGNVSQIFGELITLIEDNKRIGERESLTVNLPYSKEPPFGVPANLYIIGTMNTADRSVEALDSALRRRFSFKEIAPNSAIIKKYGEQKENKGILTINTTPFDLAKILDTINERIEILLDRDHLIGHSYFLKVNDEHTLKNAFAENIIPLLQEYFYGDYAKIILVLGEGFCQGRKVAANKLANISNNLYDTSVFNEKVIYQLTDVFSKDFNLESALQNLLGEDKDETN